MISCFGAGATTNVEQVAETLAEHVLTSKEDAERSSPLESVSQHTQLSHRSEGVAKRDVLGTKATERPPKAAWRRSL